MASSTLERLDDGTIFGIGNPLLDISADVPVSFLEAYNLKANDAILAGSQHKDLNETILRDYPNHQFVAGGSTQNSMRAATWILQQPGVCVYMGCVGQDKYHQLLHDAASKSGLTLAYQIYENPAEHVQTGTCAVLITGNDRSLVANLGAANHFTIDHFNDPKNHEHVEKAKIFYTAGFFYTVSPDTVMRLCEHANQTKKLFCTNLSAPFVCEFFGDRLMKAIPYVDYLFGNETESRSFAKNQLNLDTLNVKEIAKALSELPKKNSERPRVVIITQGADPTILAIAGQNIQEFPVKKPPKIIDTNGAGDSFVGGFLAYLALGKSNEEAIQAGAYCAYECIQQSGCTYPEKPKNENKTKHYTSLCSYSSINFDKMDNNSNNNRTSATANSSSNTNASTTTATTTSASGSSAASSAASSTATSSSIRQSHKRTFSESDSSSRTERHLCSFSHLWIINYLSSYIDDSNSTCLQSESFSPVNTPYSNTRWSLKLYPRGLNEKQHANNNIAIFLKYVSGTMPTIKAKAEFSVVSRNNELVMLRSTNFHTFSSGNDWGYSEFLDGNYLNSRRNDLITDDRLRVYVRVVLVDEKETTTGDLIRHAHHHHHHHPSSILPPPPPPPPPLPSSQHPNQQQQASTTPKIQASTSSSSASSSTATSMNNSNPSSTSTTSSAMISGLFSDDKERFKSLEFLSNQIKTLLDDERFADVHIHVISKQSISIQQQQQQTVIIDDHKKPNRTKHPRLSSKQQQQQHHPSCSSCHCTSEKIKSSSTANEPISDHHEQSSSVLCKDSESDIFDCRHSTNVSSQNYTSSSSSSVTPTIRRTTRSTSSLLSRIAQSSSSSSAESNCSTSFIEPSSSDTCSSSSLLSLSSTIKRCSCICHCQDNTEQDIHLEIQQFQLKYANVRPLATFHAHKAILMSRSSSFATQIRHSTTYNKIDSKLPSIDLYIDDLDPSTVRIMLIYIYTGRLVTSNDDMKTNINAIDLFRAAVKYDLHELRQLAKSTMLDALKVDNAIEMLEVSDQANDVSLKQQVLAFIRSNASAVSKTNNWLQFSKRYPHLVIDAFRSLVTPPSTTNTKLNNNTTTTTTTTNNNNNNNNTFHSTSLTTTSKQFSKYD
ncbi:unnamed protein product [Rotaria magnacalcarata]